jgi:hypothetical protein
LLAWFSIHVSLHETEDVIVVTGVVYIIYMYFTELACDFDCHYIWRVDADGVPFVL